MSSDFKALRDHCWKLKTTGKDHFFPRLPTPSGKRLLLMLLCLYIYLRILLVLYDVLLVAFFLLHIFA